MARQIYRRERVFDPKNGVIPVGLTKADADYILKTEDDPFIRGLSGKVRRLKLVNLGPRAVGLLSDDVERVIAEIAALPYVPAACTPYEDRRPPKKRAAR